MLAFPRFASISSKRHVCQLRNNWGQEESGRVVGTRAPQRQYSPFANMSFNPKGVGLHRLRAGRGGPFNREYSSSIYVLSDSPSLPAQFAGCFIEYFQDTFFAVGVPATSATANRQGGSSRPDPSRIDFQGMRLSRLESVLCVLDRFPANRGVRRASGGWAIRRRVCFDAIFGKNENEEG